MKKIGFIGLGKMGAGVCHNFVNKGFTVSLYDKNPAAMEQFKEKAKLCDNPVDVFNKSDCTFLSLPSSVQVEELVSFFMKEGVKGKTIIDLSTSYPMSTRKLHAEFKANGGAFLDAPLQGNPASALKGTLTALVGGDEEDFKDNEELFNAFCTRATLVGGSGAGHLYKLAFNFTGLSYAVTLSHMFPLMEKYGIDIQQLFDEMTQSTLDCGVLRLYGPKIVNRNYRNDFALGFGLKDLTYIRQLFEEFKVPAYIVDAELTLLRTAVKEGREANDFSECSAVMREFLGI